EDKNQENNKQDFEAKDKVILVYIPGIPEGIAGIIAGRLRERLYRPVVVFTDTDANPDILKGSGRSIEAYNMFEKMNEHKDLMLKFGGHPMAAGMTILKENLAQLREEVNRDSELTEDDLTKVVNIDVPMPLSYATVKLADQLDDLSPFGKGNEAPLFGYENMEILGYEILGERQNLLIIRLRDDNNRTYNLKTFRPVDFETDINRWFGEEECAKMKSGTATGKRIHITYRLEVNEYRGVRSLEYMLENWLPA
ncbi:MAG: single-stranded-DNA-specific exonuclease RecJ, partial [Eubacterium sp.]|nr:single-stranded-DNA-specific exonuclease RecJ [Eubacterium sp.]